MNFANIINHYYTPLFPSSSRSNNQSSTATPTSRTRITRACDHCQLRKTKCDSAKPRCSQCVKRGDPCTFTTRVSKRGPKPKRNIQSLYPINNNNNEERNKKSTNVYPYPSYFSMNTQQLNSGTRNPVQASYSQQNLTQNYRNLTHSYSEFLTSENYNSQMLPPIQTSSSSNSLPSSPTSGNTLTLPSLRNLSLKNSFKLPPINTLLNGSNMNGYRSDFEKLEVSSPSYYKLNGGERISLRL